MGPMADRSEDAPALHPGARVAVRNNYTGMFATGFHISEVGPGGLRVSRDRDGHVLPAVFHPDDLALLDDAPGREQR